MNVELLKEENARLHRDIGYLVSMLDELREHLDEEGVTLLDSIKRRPGSTLEEGMDAIMGVKG